MENAALELAGFYVAHAIWNVLEAEEGELLCPMLAFAYGVADTPRERSRSSRASGSPVGADSELRGACGGSARCGGGPRKGTLPLGLASRDRGQSEEGRDRGSRPEVVFGTRLVS